MKVKIAAALPLMAAALLLPAGSAMADQVSAGGTPLAVGASINASLKSGTNSTLTASNTTVTCSSSTASGTISTNPGTGNTTDVTGSISSLTFSGTAGPSSNRCTTNNSTYTTATASVAIGGGLAATADAQGGAGPNGSFTVNGVSATVTLFPTSGSSVNCTYTGNVTAGVKNTGSELAFSSALTKTGGPFVCPANGAVFGATYVLTSGGVGVALN